MTKPVRPLLLLGTRPEAIKMAPVVLEARRREKVKPIVCLSGQHRELLLPIVRGFGIEFDEHLDLMRPDQGLAEFAARCLVALDALLARVQPDCVVAQGDTTTVLAAALASFYRRVPFVHVEAGLRTGDLAQPFPEELDRRVASIVAALHCAPTPEAAENLRREGIPSGKIHVTGNTVVDALLWTVERERGPASLGAKAFPELAGKDLVLVTCHRRESFGQGLEDVCRALRELALRYLNVSFVYPVHPNPNVVNPVRRALGGVPNVLLKDPCGYSEFVWLMDHARLILTDSGGVQEEAPSLKKPVLVMRSTTERPEAVAAGAARLVGTDARTIVLGVSTLLDDPAAYARARVERNPYGDGLAAARIVDLIEGGAFR